MFDLQKFATPDFGFLSAEDKAKIAKGGFKSISTNGDKAYFYTTADCSGTPAFTLQLAKGYAVYYNIGLSRSPRSNRKNLLEFTNDVYTITVDYTNYDKFLKHASSSYAYMLLPCLGKWHYKLQGSSNLEYNFNIPRIGIYYEDGKVYKGYN